MGATVMTRQGSLFLGIQAAIILLASGAAIAWPRAGETALIIPLGANDQRDVLRWAENADARLLALNAESGRIVVHVPSNYSMLTALGSGFLPITARERGCNADASRAGL